MKTTFQEIDFTNTPSARSTLLRALVRMPKVLRIETLLEAAQRGVEFMPEAELMQDGDADVEIQAFAAHNQLNPSEVRPILQVIVEVRQALNDEIGLRDRRGHEI